MIKALAPQMSLKPGVLNNNGIIPLKVEFQPNLEVKGEPVDLMYSWNFGDGEISHEEKPSHIYKKSGEFLVQLTVTDRLHLGNIAVASLKVSVIPPVLNPKATANVNSGLIPLNVSFTGQTSITGNPCEPLYFWDFGDGTTSLEQNPVHTYRNEGTYTVNLIVKDRLNPGNMARTSLQITAKIPELRLTVALKPTTGAAPLTLIGQAFAEKEGGDKSNLKVEWAFDDGTKATGPDITHIFSKPGTYNVLITVTDEELGISKKKTIKVRVK